MPLIREFIEEKWQEIRWIMCHKGLQMDKLLVPKAS